MESTAAFRSFHCSVTNVSNAASLLERPGIASRKFAIGGKLVSSSLNQKGTVVKCLKTPETTVAKHDDSSLRGASQKSNQWRATFPTGFEALVLEVCDETEIAELKMKYEATNMHAGFYESYAAIMSQIPTNVSFPLLKSTSLNSKIKLARYGEWFNDCSDDIRICCSRAMEQLQKVYEWEVSDLGWDTKVALSVYGAFNSKEYLSVQRIRNRQMQFHKAIFAKADVIVTPTTRVTAYPIMNDALQYGELDYVNEDALVPYQIAGGAATWVEIRGATT